MDIDAAKAKLDYVIGRGRVEMYKPIQIAEVLHTARVMGGIDLSDLETYRTQSKHWRDEVSRRLLDKSSTSSAKFQDDVWNESAVPPAAMVALGAANAESGVVEAYIYGQIIEKNKKIAVARAIVANLKTIKDVESLLDAFKGKSLVRSADRLFEVLATAVFKTELSQTTYTISVDRPQAPERTLSVDGLVDLVAASPMPLMVDRLGHTNAADGGLDIWTNFGVAVNVKRRTLTRQLVEQISADTPIGSLHIVCLDIDSDARTWLEERRKDGLKISITTQDDLLDSVRALLDGPKSSLFFTKTLLDAFDREFPMAKTLNEFASARGYSETTLVGIWSLAEGGS
jgi:hypothetical protein